MRRRNGSNQAPHTALVQYWWASEARCFYPGRGVHNLPDSEASKK